MRRVHLIEPYDPSMSQEWDDFVRRSRNGTFLFERRYMDYHADRFHDRSLVIRDAKGRVECVLPANVDGHTLVSHAGLTYGGFVIDERMQTSRMLEIFQTVACYLSEQGIREWIYKVVPHIYHVHPAEEDLYALHRMGATLVGRDVAACGEPGHLPPCSQRAIRTLGRAQTAGLVFSETGGLGEFWSLVEQNLWKRYGVAPTHALHEMELLRSRFPERIRAYEARLDGVLVAGVVMYLTERVAHVQYAAANEKGRQVGALTYILVRLLDTECRDWRWLDYGISTLQRGQWLNTGLQTFKEGLGLRAVVYDSYHLALA